MLITVSRFICCHTFPCLNSDRNGTRRPLIHPALARKKEYSEISNEENKAVYPLKFSGQFLIQSAAGMLALGFIDAGYSGDWSRIGVISRGTEDLLKAAAFVVVPLCLSLIFSLSKKDHEE